jgi:hypothetical protein
VNEYLSLLQYLVGPAILGLVAWVYSIQRALEAHRLDVAERYVRHPELTKMETVMSEIQHQLAEILKTVHELKGAAAAK